METAALSIVENFYVVKDEFSGDFTGDSGSWFTHSVFRVQKTLSETACSNKSWAYCLSSFQWLSEAY
jgi:hypothetical protein